MPLQEAIPAKTSISTARETYIAVVTVIAIAAHLILRYSTHLPPSAYLGPLFLALVVGGIPILLTLGKKLWRENSVRTCWLESPSLLPLRWANTLWERSLF